MGVVLGRERRGGRGGEGGDAGQAKVELEPRPTSRDDGGGGEPCVAEAGQKASGGAYVMRGPTRGQSV